MKLRDFLNEEYPPFTTEPNVHKDHYENVSKSHFEDIEWQLYKMIYFFEEAAKHYSATSPNKEIQKNSKRFTAIASELKNTKASIMKALALFKKGGNSGMLLKIPPVDSTERRNWSKEQ
jgi:hypothetical protein